MRLDVCQLVANQSAICKRSCGFKKVGEIELAVRYVGSFIAAKIYVNRRFPGVWVNVIIGIDGVEEDEWVSAVV